MAKKPAKKGKRGRETSTGTSVPVRPASSVLSAALLSDSCCWQMCHNGEADCQTQCQHFSSFHGVTVSQDQEIAAWNQILLSLIYLSVLKLYVIPSTCNNLCQGML